ncbi:MAG: hypothetical protein HQK54_13370 [Oligoflexales bacterium]|nr:hypothetical protein [Oligoflexales bacterium]
MVANDLPMTRHSSVHLQFIAIGPCRCRVQIQRGYGSMRGSWKKMELSKLRIDFRHLSILFQEPSILQQKVFSDSQISK